jgi:hypothetical protein
LYDVGPQASDKWKVYGTDPLLGQHSKAIRVMNSDVNVAKQFVNQADPREHYNKNTPANQHMHSKGEHSKPQGVDIDVPYGYYWESMNKGDVSNTSGNGTLREGFQHPHAGNGGDIEFIRPADVDIDKRGTQFKLEETPISESSKKSIKFSINPYLMFFVFILLWLALDYWIRSAESFIVQYVHKGKELGYKWLAFYAILFTLLFLGVAWWMGVPSAELEI